VSKMSETLSRRLGFDEGEIESRKALLGFGPAEVVELSTFLGAAKAIADAVASDFYRHLAAFPEVKIFFHDETMMERLHEMMQDYIVQLFSGDYGPGYVESRLQMGYHHARIGLPPKHFIFSLHYLKDLISAYLMRSGLLVAPPEALAKIVIFDLQLVFDAYVYQINESDPGAKPGLLDMGSGMMARWFALRRPAGSSGAA